MIHNQNLNLALGLVPPECRVGSGTSQEKGLGIFGHTDNTDGMDWECPGTAGCLLLNVGETLHADTQYMQQPSSKYHNQSLNSATRVSHSHAHIYTWAHFRGGVRLCPFSVWRWQPRLSPHFQPLGCSPPEIGKMQAGSGAGGREMRVSGGWGKWRYGRHSDESALCSPRLGHVLVSFLTSVRSYPDFELLHRRPSAETLRSQNRRK